MKFDKQISIWMKGRGTDMEFNPLLSKSYNIDDDTERYTRRLLENSAWYSGISEKIRFFYLREAPKLRYNGLSNDEENLFWSQVNKTEQEDITRIHSGLPQLISKKMVDLLTSNGYSISVSEDEKNTIRLNEILSANKFHALIQKAIETESWAGGVAFKLSISPYFKEPIIEVVQPENYKPFVVSGRIVKDIFMTYYKRDKRTFKLSEIYGVNEKGSYIDYKLEEMITDSNGGFIMWKDVPLSSLEETTDLKPFIVEGYFKKLSIYKPNKVQNSEFKTSILGESDYAGAYGSYNGIDEVLSTWMQEFRDGKLQKYFPSNLKGFDPVTGRDNTPSAIKSTHIVYSTGIGEETDKQQIEYHQGDIRTDKHEQSFKTWMQLALNLAGLSPLTIGVTGLEAMNAGEASQSEREKVSIRTRNAKAELWEEAMKELLPSVLVLDDIMNTISTEGNAVTNEYNIIFKFNDYILKSRADRVTEVSMGLASGVYDLESAIDYVHTDKTDEQKVLIRVNSKIEKGINIFTKEEELVYTKYINELDIE